MTLEFRWQRLVPPPMMRGMEPEVLSQKQQTARTRRQAGQGALRMGTYTLLGVGLIAALYASPWLREPYYAWAWERGRFPEARREAFARLMGTKPAPRLAAEYVQRRAAELLCDADSDAAHAEILRWAVLGYARAAAPAIVALLANERTNTDNRRLGVAVLASIWQEVPEAWPLLLPAAGDEAFEGTRRAILQEIIRSGPAEKRCLPALFELLEQPERFVTRAGDEATGPGAGMHRLVLDALAATGPLEPAALFTLREIHARCCEPALREQLAEALARFEKAGVTVP